MNPSIPIHGEQGALPPGLVEAAARHLEPGESLRWIGHGSRFATFVALAPGMLLFLLILGPFAWILLQAEGWRLQGTWTSQPGDVSADAVGKAIGIGIAAIPLWYLYLFIRRVVGAGRSYIGITDRRLLVIAGWKTLSIARDDIEHALAEGSLRRPSLAFRIRRDQSGRVGPRPSLFGVYNIDAAFGECRRLGIAFLDRRRRAEDEEARPGGLALGETIKWSGRRGWRAVDPSRWFLVAVAPALLPYLFGWWIWSKLSFSNNEALNTFIAAGVMALFLGPLAFFVLRAGGPFFRDMLVDIFGQLAVTDRRILFLYPVTGTVARHITGEHLRAADLVEVDESGRGQIVLTLARQDKDEPEWVDLFAVPDAAEAVDAMARVVRQ